MDTLTHFRAEIDAFLAQHPQSPLDYAQRADFAGLNYYPASKDFIFEVEVEKFGDDEPLIEMDTSTGDLRPYRRYGRFTFQVNGQDAALTVYSDPHGHDFFLPFRDATSYHETYGAGRYMDNHRPALTQHSTTRFRVDFNYSYSPYCAYQSNYSCPLPPRENWLQVAIEAGEKDFPLSKHD